MVAFGRLERRGDRDEEVSHVAEHEEHHVVIREPVLEVHAVPGGLSAVRVQLVVHEVLAHKYITHVHQ